MVVAEQPTSSATLGARLDAVDDAPEDLRVLVAVPDVHLARSDPALPLRAAGPSHSRVIEGSRKKADSTAAGHVPR